MLGEQLYQAQGKITGNRVLDAASYKIESSYSVQGKLNGIDVIEMGTFWAVMRPSGILYGEDEAVVMTMDGDVAQGKPIGVGRFVGPGKISYRGAVVYGDNCTGKLAFMNGKCLLFEVEVDQMNATISIKAWEWK